MTKYDKKDYLFYALLISITAIIAVAHLYRLNNMPNGLHDDELANGYNALLIAETGHDEHGQAWPVYFASFGDYKHPILIYAIAFLIKLLGPSDFVVRLTSAMFFGIFLVGLYSLINLLTNHNRTVLLYTLITAGFLPWFFTLSRIAYAVITQPAVIVWALVFAYKTFHSNKSPWYNAALCGFLSGLSIYTYSTARLLTPLFIIFLVAIYVNSRNYKKIIILLLFAALALIPFIIFNLQQPKALTARFQILQPIMTTGNTTLSQFSTDFFANYSKYFSPDYLLLNGDTKNGRHATGYFGQIYFITFILVIHALIWLIAQRAYRNRFTLFLVANSITAPIAAAIVYDYSPHALRSVLLGVYLVILSSLGLHFFLQRFLVLRLKNTITLLIFYFLIAQSTAYVHNYFTDYRLISKNWFNPEQSMKTQVVKAHYEQ